MSILYETTLRGLFLEEVYTSLSGYTMRRELYGNCGRMGTWVLRNPNGEFVDAHDYRLALCLKYGFTLDERDTFE